MISGDCLLPDLGISNDDRKLLAANVSIVYHCAATVRFDEALKRAVLLNTRATKLMLELCKTFKKLDVRNDRVCNILLYTFLNINYYFAAVLPCIDSI